MISWQSEHLARIDQTDQVCTTGISIDVGETLIWPLMSEAVVHAESVNDGFVSMPAISHHDVALQMDSNLSIVPVA